MALYENVKDALSLIQKTDNLELYSKIIDVQKEAMDLLEENRNLKNRMHQLQEELNTKKSVEYIEDAYYVKRENGTYDGPYCRVCWDKDNKLIRMSIGSYNYGCSEAACMVCNFAAEKIMKTNKE
ncbi:Uncharacterised protein [uncultured Clostridium sp.]|uniref:hypothetical protein n=1 Tax=uncultured Clostridium sp. TaxID=59620 RepID=UPI0008206DB8|nr:hypothetical protein [uncultured Clostridium sp.]SCJ52537.1 Uncharacterised protein [uncultured Clostridium sp.]